MPYRATNALAAGMVALAAARTMAGQATILTPTPPDTQTDTPTEADTSVQTDTPVPEQPRPCPSLRDPDGAPLRPVPNVVGMTRDDADSALALGGFGTDAKPSDAAGDWPVSKQDPGPDRAGSSPNPSGTPPPLWLVATAAVTAVVAVWTVRRVRRRPRRAPASSVACVPNADPSPRVEVRDLAPEVSCAFVGHHDLGRQEIREIVR